eukprot:CAMPEP_0171497140 /NCGR_PEP_ID=MMETSP0958-20121227/7100_1 /TAXON_ID=87120 /ORGANISM="Aurantiochytrium limacinum, Strain ATCCMYA-1381" /LENGTH=262 /DNA_ID=CAMNT_0012031337 /DNA_START=234 /DNA_END=1022 /DNA_ORIENTATION=-
MRLSRGMSTAAMRCLASRSLAESSAMSVQQQQSSFLRTRQAPWRAVSARGFLSVKTSHVAIEDERERPCWKCGEMTPASGLFCGFCDHLQAPDEHASHFEVFKLPESFDIDVDNLERQFWSLQKKLHPDRFGYRHEKEQEHSAEYSSRVNNAYKVLKSPLNRAVYMLERRGIDALSEGGTSNVDPELLMKVMEMREELHSTNSPEVLSRLEEGARADVSEFSHQISDAFARDDMNAATQAAIELRYAEKLCEEIEAKRMSNL